MSTKARQFARRALNISNTLGLRRAAKFLANRDVSLDEALFILLGTRERA